MKTVFEHIEYVRERPHHVRKQIAIAAAASGTALIALVWFIGSISTGAFSIKENSSLASESDAAAGSISANQNLAGAGAAAALPQAADAPAHIEIVDTAPPAAGEKRAEPTTIPF